MSEPATHPDQNKTREELQTECYNYWMNKYGDCYSENTPTCNGCPLESKGQ
jgi:hypothetical protein